MYSTYGTRPDGKPYSYLPFPFHLPECPGNKLVAFDDFTASEATLLTSFIASMDYQRLVQRDTSYYRAYLLAKKLGRPEVRSLGLLLSAIWQVSTGEMSGKNIERGDAQLLRYQNTFVQEVSRLGSSLAAKDRIWLQARAANAAREMKLFEEAERMRKRAEKSLALLPEKGGWDIYLAKLQGVISRRDASVEPLDMIPDQQVAFACARQQPSTAFDRAACAKPGVAALAAELRRSKRQSHNLP